MCRGSSLLVRLQKQLFHYVVNRISGNVLDGFIWPKHALRCELVAARASQLFTCWFKFGRLINIIQAELLCGKRKILKLPLNYN